MLPMCVQCRCPSTRVPSRRDVESCQATGPDDHDCGFEPRRRGCMIDHYDALETRDPELREREAFAAIRAQIAHAKQHAPAFARVLGDAEPADIVDRASLARVPVTRKSELLELQQ